MINEDEKWASFHMICSRDVQLPGVYNVTFGYGLASMVSPGEPTKKAPRPVRVQVKVDGEDGELISYTPGEEDLGFTREEYVARAIDWIKHHGTSAVP